MRGTRASSAPLAGSVTAKVPPASASIHRPPTYARSASRSRSLSWSSAAICATGESYDRTITPRRSSSPRRSSATPSSLSTSSVCWPSSGGAVGGRACEKGDRDPPVRRAEGLVRDDARVRVAVPPRFLAGHERVLRHVHEPGEGAVEERDLDQLAFARSPAAVERGEDRGRGVETREDVDERDADLRRLAVRRARDRHQPALRLPDDVVA